MIFFISRFLKVISSLTTILILKFFTNDYNLGEYLYWYVLFLFLGIFIKFNSQVFFLKFKFNYKKYFLSFTYWQCLFTLISIVFVAFYLNFTILLVSIPYFIFFLFDPWEYLYTITKNYKKANNVIIYVSLFSIFLKSILLFFTKNYLIYLTISSLDFSVGFILFLLTKQKNKYFLIYKKRYFTKVFVFMLPFLLNSLVIYLTAKVDHFLIKSFFDYKQLGIYGFTYRIYEGFFIFQVILNSIIISKFNDDLKLDKISNKFFDFCFKWFVLSFILLIIFSIFLYFSLHFSFLNTFFIELKLLLILLPSVLISFFGLLMSLKCSVNGNSKEVLSINLITLLLNVILNLYFLPRYGIFASAFITLLNQLLSSLLLWFIFPRTRMYIFYFLKR